MAAKPFYLNWWFWILLIGIVVIIVGVILFFASNLGVTTWIIIGVGALLVVLGIIFMIIYIRKPKPKDDSLSSKIPGVAEAAYFGEKTGLRSLEERKRQQTLQGIQSAYRGTKNLVTSEKFKGRTLKAAQIGASVGNLLIPGSPLELAALGLSGVQSYRNISQGKGLEARIFNKEAYQREQFRKKLEQQQKLQQIQQEFQQQQLQQQPSTYTNYLGGNYYM